jgi:hypothetical protein
MSQVAEAGYRTSPGPEAIKQYRERQARLRRMAAEPAKPVVLKAVPLVAAPVIPERKPRPPAPAPEPATFPSRPAAKAVAVCEHCGTGIDVPSAGASRIHEIQALVCRQLDVRRVDLMSHRRFRDSMVARQIAMFLCKKYTPNSLPDIGRRFGGRDHTTVLHAARRVAQMMSSPPGTGLSEQWPAPHCDFVREAVTQAEIIIARWGTRSSRMRHPARSAEL